MNQKATHQQRHLQKIKFAISSRFSMLTDLGFYGDSSVSSEAVVRLSSGSKSFFRKFAIVNISDLGFAITFLLLQWKQSNRVPSLALMYFRQLLQAMYHKFWSKDRIDMLPQIQYVSLSIYVRWHHNNG